MEREGQQVETAQWNDGWIQVKVPLPFSLKWVNSYLIPEPDQSGYTVIDPGLRTDEAVAAWNEAMQRHDIDVAAIKRIIVTHQHPDHYGLAGYFQELSGAPVYMSRRSHAYTVRLWAEGSRFAEELGQLFSGHGMPDELTSAIAANLELFEERVSPQPSVTYMKAGESIRFGGFEWQLIDAPGHAYGQLLLYEPNNGWMFCGDQVIPRITPNISVVPGEETDPLNDFLTNLDELLNYDVSFAFPGHRDPFTGFAARIEELKQHHIRRLERMKRMLDEPMSAFELSERLFGINLRSNPHNLRFAMAETLAHLYYMEHRGLIRRLEGASAYLFHAV
ncbi:MBL fold metallo-hydrolase [Paenibacillus radicis (ex Gao et al. 2016)]|uniref:MBL fold metallo-hydrolase n=1 Tax=Paenibacillus radicis (ex Gao et al. 2016) TaxID=1737354 RepID=A0A917HCP6_9BACL|nr:MBL fold metallo-hydrolase [Paenibacillus radicis (ex Gao et al. 2016)]GGG74595.1 MBL fold metallo-hydrolase [Paenibacillus radicis (ex Gao et al. 2016)]